MLNVSPETSRTLTAKGQETRQRIVDAASDLMVQHGAAEVTLDDVGVATSTSRSQMYHYFGSKNELVDAVVLCVRDRVFAFQGDLLRNAHTFADLERWADVIVLVQRQSGVWCGCPLGTLAYELVNETGDERLDIRRAFEAWRMLIQTALQSIQAAGNLRADADLASLATATLASLQGGLLMAKSMQDETPLVVALDAALAHLRSFAV